MRGISMINKEFPPNTAGSKKITAFPRVGISKKDVKVEEVMKKDLVVAHPLTLQERIVRKAYILYPLIIKV